MRGTRFPASLGENSHSRAAKRNSEGTEGETMSNSINPAGSVLLPDFESETGTRYKTNLDNDLAAHQRLAGLFAPQEGGPLKRFVPGDVSAANDTFDWVDCPLPADTPVKLEVSADGSLPAPLVAGTTYYIGGLGSPVTTIQLKTDTASPATTVNLTDTGSGSFILVPQPVLNVWIGPGHLWNGSALTEVAGQFAGAITAPSANPRIDRVVLDPTDGSVSIVTGSEAATPAAPAITAGHLPICQVLLDDSPATTAITNSEITDERAVAVAAQAVGNCAFFARLTTTQQVLDTTPNTVLFDSVDFDEGADFDYASSPNVAEFTAPVTGIYAFQFVFSPDEFGSGELFGSIRKNGNSLVICSTATNLVSSAAAVTVKLSAGDVITCTCDSTIETSYKITGDDVRVGSTWFSGHLVRAA